MKNLHSPYVVEVYNYNDKSNEYVMEFMDCSLYDYITENISTLDYNQKKNIALQILKAFSYIHSKRLLHRDISPKNVLIKRYDDVLVVKISDFGLVRIPESNLTSFNTEVKGCLNDPNLWVVGFNNYDAVHETFALTRLMQYIMEGTIDIGKMVTPGLREFIAKGLSQKESNRFQNVDELTDAFKKLKF